MRFFDHETTVEQLNDGGVHSLPRDARLHLNVECPPEGLTINACGREGKIILFISKTSRPNSAAYDRKIEIEEGECHNTFINCSTDESERRRRQAVPEERIFMTIEGKGEENEYELQASLGDSSTPQGTYCAHMPC